MTCLVAGGHGLVEGVPGLGKTLLVRTLSQALDLRFSRIQFTPDLMPADIIGTNVIEEDERGSRTFRFERGPVFGNILLADEINRATPKTQSALLEAMSDRQVTAEGETRPLPEPFLVLATQNPLEIVGTYPLPESQLDRFLMRIRIGYPDSMSEREILKDSATAQPAQPVLAVDELLHFQERIGEVRVDDSLVDYMMAVVERTRNHDSLALGVSPRGAQSLYRAAQALALVEGREYAIPDDVKRLVVPIFAHRVVVNTRVALSQRTSDMSDRILEEILTEIEVPL
jgi:MoxR-like ATPase